MAKHDDFLSLAAVTSCQWLLHIACSANFTLQWLWQVQLEDTASKQPQPQPMTPIAEGDEEVRDECTMCTWPAITAVATTSLLCTETSHS